MNAPNPRTVAATHSIDIRDAIYERIAGRSGMFKTMRKVPVPPLMPVDLPACSVFVLNETDTSDGAPNIGSLKYINDAVIAISVARAFDDPVYLEAGIAGDLVAIKDLLLTDAEFTKRLQQDKDPENNGLFESIPSMRAYWVFAQQAEAYFAEMRLEMTFRFREGFWPLITDRFLEADFRVRLPHHRDATAIEELIDIPQRGPHDVPVWRKRR